MTAPWLERRAVAGGGTVTIDQFADNQQKLPWGSTFKNASGTTTISIPTSAPFSGVSLSRLDVIAEGGQLNINTAQAINRLTKRPDQFATVVENATLTADSRVAGNAPSLSVTGATIVSNTSEDNVPVNVTVGAATITGIANGVVTLVGDLSDAMPALRKFGTGIFKITSVTPETAPIAFINEEGETEFDEIDSDPAVVKGMNWSVSVHAMAGWGASSVESLKSQNLRSLSIAANASASILELGSRVLNLDSLNIAAGGTLDMMDNDLILRTSAGNKDMVHDAVNRWIVSAQNGVDSNFITRWDGWGLKSSKARTQNVGAGFDLVGLGAIRNSDLDITTAVPGSTYTTFSEQTVKPDYVLVKFTYTGDGNLDGTITLDDYAAMDAAFFHVIQVLGWSTGDVNFDGVINFDDYAVVDQAFFQQFGVL
jgi:hypothetical protein